KALQKFLVVGDHRPGSSLLQHDLRDQDSIGVAGLSPGEIAFRALVPLDEFGREGQRDPSRTCMNSASTRNCLCSSSGPNSMATYSGLSGFRRMARCRHWSSPAGPVSLVYTFTVNSALESVAPI